MKHQEKIEETKNAFLNQLNSADIMCGSIFTRSEVSEIVKKFAELVSTNLDSVFEDTPPAAISEEKIDRIVELAEQFAHLYAEDCADNYDFNSCAEFDTNDYGGELRVTVDVRVDGSDLKSSGSFQDGTFKSEIMEVLCK
jgi:hypothetical protein